MSKRNKCKMPKISSVPFLANRLISSKTKTKKKKMGAKRKLGLNIFPRNSASFYYFLSCSLGSCIIKARPT